MTASDLAPPAYSAYVPLRITAHLEGGFSVSQDQGVGLDSLLMSVVAKLLQKTKAIRSVADLDELEIPVSKHPSGRYYLASFGEYQVQDFEKRYLTKRPPITEYRRQSTLKSIDIGAGPDKLQRDVVPILIPDRGLVQWYAVGDPARLFPLLHRAPSLGRRHAAGFGAVYRWSCEPLMPAELWEGFPVLRDGCPLRPLPLDTSGLTTFREHTLRLLPPYWLMEGQEPCAIPVQGWGMLHERAQEEA